MKCAVYTGSRNLYAAMSTAAKSLIANSDVDRVYLLIEDCWFPSELPPIVDVVNVSKQAYFPAGGPNMKSGYTYLALMRAALALMPEFSDFDRILSLDVDTVCVRDISDIWGLPIDSCYFSASIEPHRCLDGETYCNTGVALYNLDMLRDGKARDVVDELNSERYPNVEQDVFNYACQGFIHRMPSEYNAAKGWTEPCEHPRIVHWAGRKFGYWTRRPEFMAYRDMPWREVMRRHGEICGL